VRVKEKWGYLYRAIDTHGNLVDSRLSEKRDMEAAQQFLKQALAVLGRAPECVMTDGHASSPRAVRETVDDHVQHRISKYLTNRLEQDHRGIKQRYYVVSDVLTQRPVSVRPSMAYEILSVLALLWENHSLPRATTSFP
jgi:transposase-like protein